MMEVQTEMPGNSTTTVGSTLQEEELKRIIYELKQKCYEMLAFNSTIPSEPYCPGLFDGWACWPNTPAGQKAYAPCPAFITGFDESLMAHKICEPNGSWFRHPESNQVWSNYTTCINMVDYDRTARLNVIYETGYTMSLIALVLSLAILTYFRSLRCARTTLHMNLFASFAVNNTLWLIWYGFVVANSDLLMQNGISCRLLHVILHYFLLTNYAWMLCEGLYLHTLLVSAFTSEHNLVKWLMAVGWSTPAIIVMVYATLRATSSDPKDNSQCWIDEGNYINVLVFPVCVSTLLNLLFLFNIVRVLLTKLRAGPAIGSRPSRSMLQAFRATLLLVPLLGLHYLLTPFRPPTGHPWEQAYGIISALTASFQGLCVATLFCFCNGEVIAQFKRKWEGSSFIRKRASSCTATTVSRPSRVHCGLVGCFSLSARPQVRWRERRRCDYHQTELPLSDLIDDKEKRDKIGDNEDTRCDNDGRLLIINNYQTPC